MARLAESGEGCVEAKQNLPVALPAAGRGELAFDHLLGKATPCQKDYGWGSWQQRSIT